MSDKKFEPKKYVVKIKGKDYLEVKFRTHWFRQEHPAWQIKTEIVKLDLLRGVGIMKAQILNEKGELLSSGHKMEYQKNFFDYLEKAETGAIGRALAALGYGTLQCFDLDEGIDEGRICDAPVGPSNNNFQSSQNGSPKKASTKQKTFIYNLMNNLDIDKEHMMEIFFDCAKREIKSSNDLTVNEASKVIEYLKEHQAGQAPAKSFVTSEELPFYTEPPQPEGSPFVKCIPTGEDVPLPEEAPPPAGHHSNSPFLSMPTAGERARQ